MDYSTISFPALGIEWDPIRSFSIGPLNIHLYGILIATGLLLAVLYACRRSRQFGLTEDTLTDGVLWVTPFAFLCARLYYCIFYWDQGGYADNLLSVFYVWQGGLAIYGGVIGAIVGIIVFCKVKKISIGAVLDIVALGFLIGQSMGRWGNFFNREAFGAATDSFLRMGLTSPLTGVTEYYHPTFLYESLWNLAGFIGLHFLSKHRRYDGQIALGYAAWYGLGRSIIEGLRMDSLYWGPIRVSQLLAVVSCLAAAGVLLVLSFREHDPADLLVNRVSPEPQEEKKAEDSEIPPAEE